MSGTRPAAPAPASAEEPGEQSTPGPVTGDGYGRGVVLASMGGVVVGTLLVAASYGVDAAPPLRSGGFGAGLVAVSTGATALVSALLYRAAPAATAPALAALYLVKVMVFGWLLLVPGAPPWLVPPAFVAAAVVTLVAAMVAFAVIARRVSARAALGRPVQDDAAPDASTSNENSTVAVAPSQTSGRTSP